VSDEDRRYPYIPVDDRGRDAIDPDDPVDVASYDSFPASDPPARTGTRAQPTQRNPTPESMPFLTDLKTIRQRARQHLEDGAVTTGYQEGSADREQVIRILNDALATEIVCNLRYRAHYFMASGIHSKAVAAEFQEHAQQEQQHADWLAKRITQLGGKPDFNPAGLTSRSHAEYAEGDSLIGMIREDLVAERIAIDTYREIAAYLGTADPTSRRLMEAILEQEEEHADDLANLLAELGSGLG
jgi:bacterioferritin